MARNKFTVPAELPDRLLLADLPSSIIEWQSDLGPVHSWPLAYWQMVAQSLAERLNEIELDVLGMQRALRADRDNEEAEG